MEPEAREQVLCEAELAAARCALPVRALRGADGGALRAEEVP